MCEREREEREMLKFTSSGVPCYVKVAKLDNCAHIV